MSLSGEVSNLRELLILAVGGDYSLSPCRVAQSGCRARGPATLRRERQGLCAMDQNVGGWELTLRPHGAPVLGHLWAWTS